MATGRGKASGVGVFARGSRLTAFHSQWSHELWELGRVADAIRKVPSVHGNKPQGNPKPKTQDPKPWTLNPKP